MSNPVAFLFPGQGAQEVGMGRDLFKDDAFARGLMAVASDAAGEDLERIVLRGPARKLADTVYLQPAMTVVSLSLWRRLCDAGVAAAAVAGHSVGELSAVAASGMAEPATMVTLAALRGRLMGEAAAETEGCMAALTGVSYEAVRWTLDASEQTGVLAVGAVNAPGQIVLTGDSAEIEAASKTLPGALGVKWIPLRVSGAWHSPHMASAVQPFRDALVAAGLKKGTVPMVLNRNGETITTPDDLPTLLADQLTRPVRFDRVVKTLLDMGIETFVEIGPGKVVRGLLRLNAPDVDLTVYNVSDRRSLERAISALA